MQFIYIFHIIICVFLVLTILFQDGKAGGFAGPADTATAQAMFGAKGAGDFLTKVTTYLAVFFMVTSLTLALLDSEQNKSIGDDFVPDQTEQTTTLGDDAAPTSDESGTTEVGDTTTPPGAAVVIEDEQGNKVFKGLDEAIEGIEIVPHEEAPEEIKELHRQDRERVEALKKEQEAQANDGEDDLDL